MENLYISLVLMFVSAITFIAYKHPRLYDKRLFWIFFVASSVVYLGATFFDGGIEYAFNSLKEFIPPEKIIEAKKVTESIQSEKYVSFGAAAMFVYNFVLWIFGIMLEFDKEDDK